MNIIQSYKVKYWVFCYDGNIFGPYKDVNEFAKVWNSDKYRISSSLFGNTFYWDGYKKEDFIRDLHFGKNMNIIIGDFILKNEFGDIIEPDEVSNILRNYRNKIYKKRYYPYCNKVPGSKTNPYRVYRQFKNNQHSRKWQEAHNKLDIKMRKHRYIPNTWDDIKRSNYCNNNWKRYRKTQYK